MFPVTEFLPKFHRKEKILKYNSFILQTTEISEIYYITNFDSSCFQVTDLLSMMFC